VRSDILTPLITDSTGSLDIKPCRVVEIYWLLAVTSCLPSSSVFYIEDGGRQHVPPKSRYIYTDKDVNISENNIQIKKNEMGEACSTYAGEDRCIQGFGGEG
jgi:hypothetical protein